MTELSSFDDCVTEESSETIHEDKNHEKHHKHQHHHRHHHGRHRAREELSAALAGAADDGLANARDDQEDLTAHPAAHFERLESERKQDNGTHNGADVVSRSVSSCCLRRASDCSRRTHVSLTVLSLALSWCIPMCTCCVRVTTKRRSATTKKIGERGRQSARSATLSHNRVVPAVAA